MAIPRTKTFNDKRYQLFKTYDKKAGALAKAAWARDNGYHARVVTDVENGKTKYSMYYLHSR